MMKIIKEGQKDFIAKCTTCGCEFLYQLVDIGVGSVVCPCCGGYVAHKEFKEPSTDTREIPCTVTQQTTSVLKEIEDLIGCYWGTDPAYYTGSENKEEADAAKLCCKILGTIWSLNHDNN